MAAAKMTLSVLFGGFFLLLLYLYESLVLKPKRQRSKLEKQGIRGPPPSSFLLGNIPEIKSIKAKVLKNSRSPETSISHDWPSTIFPHLVQWRNEYGNSHRSHYLYFSVFSLAVFVLLDYTCMPN